MMPADTDLADWLRRGLGIVDPTAAPVIAEPAIDPDEAELERRRRERERKQRYRARRRVRHAGGEVVELHLTWSTLHGLRRLGLLPDGDCDPDAVAHAVGRYLAGTTQAVAELAGRFAAR